MQVIESINKARILGYIMMIIYLGFICYFAFFAEVAGRNLVQERAYNMIPFHAIKEYINRVITAKAITYDVNIYGNLGVFMPLGILMPFSIRVKKYFNYALIVTLAGLILSLFIEINQYIFAVGVFDVDDLILNSIGSLLGYILYVLVKKFAIKST